MTIITISRDKDHDTRTSSFEVEDIYSLGSDFIKETEIGKSIEKILEAVKKELEYLYGTRTTA